MSLFAGLVLKLDAAAPPVASCSPPISLWAAANLGKASPNVGFVGLGVFEVWPMAPGSKVNGGSVLDRPPWRLLLFAAISSKIGCVLGLLGEG